MGIISKSKVIRSLEEGYFYKGVKHGRWMRYNTHDILQDKENLLERVAAGVADFLL